MAILKIVTDSEILHKKSKPVETFDARLHQLLDDMRETLINAHGYGIAAVQVGVLYRICIVGTPDGYIELVNPQIVAQSKPKLGDEGCLSIKNIRMNVIRPQRVTVSAFDRYGKPFQVILKNMPSICACHEVDHLDGILFTDRAAEQGNTVVTEDLEEYGVSSRVASPQPYADPSCEGSS